MNRIRTEICAKVGARIQTPIQCNKSIAIICFHLLRFLHVYRLGAIDTQSGMNKTTVYVTSSPSLNWSRKLNYYPPPQRKEKMDFMPRTHTHTQYPQ